MTEKSSYDDNDDCNDRYDRNDCNFDDNDERMTKNIQLKKGPPPFRAMPESQRHSPQLIPFLLDLLMLNTPIKTKIRSLLWLQQGGGRRVGLRRILMSSLLLFFYYFLISHFF